MGDKKYGELHIKLPADLIWEGKERAKQQKISFNKLIMRAIREHMMRLRLHETKINVVPADVLIKKKQDEIDEAKKELYILTHGDNWGIEKKEES
ncbi:MAG: hypothetical protein E3J76_01590 [Candidatus Aminicenantes bacterium]|nr:MAG: hypothetical protein E3J76_01590 [Candidatus Aminicenantes bacterium]